MNYKRNGTREYFVGVDPSLTGNAIVIIDERGEYIEGKLIASHKDCYLNGEQRVWDVFNQVKYIANVVRLDSVYIEGLSYMSVSPTLFERCALLYSILMFLLEREVKYKIIPPMTLKKFVTGHGHAKKDQMMTAIKDRWGMEFTDDNLADAYGLARMALTNRGKSVY